MRDDSFHGESGFSSDPIHYEDTPCPLPDWRRHANDDPHPASHILSWWFVEDPSKFAIAIRTRYRFGKTMMLNFLKTMDRYHKRILPDPDLEEDAE